MLANVPLTKAKHRIKSGVYVGVDSKAMNNGRGDWLGVTVYHTLYVWPISPLLTMLNLHCVPCCSLTHKSLPCLFCCIFLNLCLDHSIFSLQTVVLFYSSGFSQNITLPLAPIQPYYYYITLFLSFLTFEIILFMNFLILVCFVHSCIPRIPNRSSTY